MSARFFVIEGIDGAGTTTQTRLLCDWMQGCGWAVLATREPSAGPVGRLLREILVGGYERVDGPSMALLFAADRFDHLAREIEPALANGRHVVSDRYYHSSLAYQSEETDARLVKWLADHVRAPDLTFVLDVTAEEAARRRLAAGRPAERYDALSLQTKIAENYRALAAGRGAREPVVLVDGSGKPEQVAARLREEVEKRCASELE